MSHWIYYFDAHHLRETPLFRGLSSCTSTTSTRPGCAELCRISFTEALCFDMCMCATLLAVCCCFAYWHTSFDNDRTRGGCIIGITPSHQTHHKAMDETPDLTSLRRQLQSRAAEKESAELFFSQERAAIEESQRHAAESLSLANDALSARRRRAQELDRDLVKQSVNRTRQLSYKEDRIARVEESCAETKCAIETLVEARDRQQKDLQAARQALSEIQQRADMSLQRTRNFDAQIAEAKRESMATDAQRAHLSSNERAAREELEVQLRELDSISSVLHENIKNVTVASTGSETAHATRMADMKRSLAATRDMYDNTRGHLTNVRNALSAMERDEEDAARRRRKSEEETTKEFLAARKADLMKSTARREEHLRHIRSEYDRQAASLQAAIEDASASLGPIREATQENFYEEMRLGEVLSQLREMLCGEEELRERCRTADEALRTMKEHHVALSREVEALALKRNDLVGECTMVREVVAPLSDVEASVAALRDRVHADRQQLADIEARSVIQRVALEGRIEGLQAENSTIRSSIDNVGERKTQLLEEVADRDRALHSDLRVLLAEGDALEAKLLETRQRNSLLQTSIEHNARQKKLLEEDLANRRELARRAAATLLAQLEQN